jgi:predicted ATPase
MQIKFTNFGPIREANIELGDLTVICGPNNTGKTYISYSIFGLFKLWEKFADFNIDREDINELSEKGFIKIDLKKYEQRLDKVITSIFKKYTENINLVFYSQEDAFPQLAIEGNIDKIEINYANVLESSFGTQKNRIIQIKKDADSIILEVTILSKHPEDTAPQSLLRDIINLSLVEIFFKNIIGNPFLIPAERSGIALFYKELSINKSRFLEKLIRHPKDADFDPDMLGKTFKIYPLPIQEHIDFHRDLDQIKKRRSSLFKSKFSKGVEDILKGNFEIREDDVLFYTQDPQDKHDNIGIPLDLSSSAVKSLLGLDIYLKHVAKEGDILLIDEPELNLHPDNQRKIARLLATLVNHNIKVLITTHSDYIIKELGNLVMLSNDFKDKNSIIEEYGYRQDEFLSPSQLKVYTADNGTLQKIEVDPKAGIALETFDQTINAMNASSDDIYFAIN